jgi:hypothetical protein
MATCIRCKDLILGKPGESICPKCAGEIVDNYASIDEIIALAKVGMCALIDESTGYQYHRPADDLRLELFKKIINRKLLDDLLKLKGSVT